MLLQGHIVGAYAMLLISALLFFVCTPVYSLIVVFVFNRIFDKNGHIDEIKPFWVKLLIVVGSIVIGIVLAIVTVLLFGEFFFKDLSFD